MKRCVRHWSNIDKIIDSNFPYNICCQPVKGPMICFKCHQNYISKYQIASTKVDRQKKESGLTEMILAKFFNFIHRDWKLIFCHWIHPTLFHLFCFTLFVKYNKSIAKFFFPLQKTWILKNFAQWITLERQYYVSVCVCVVFDLLHCWKVVL